MSRGLIIVRLALLLSLIGTAATLADTASNLTAYWPFTQLSTIDATAHGYDGAGHDVFAVTDRNGNVAAALVFNGNSSVVEVGNVFAMRDQQTIVAWVKPSAIATTHPIVEKAIPGYGGEVDLQLFLLSDGKILWSVVTDNGGTGIFSQAIGSSVLPAFQWSFVAGVIDRANNQIRLYVNGTLDATASMGGLGVRNQNRPFRIGKRVGNQATQYFNGAIDEVRLYDRALSASDLVEVMNIPSPPGQGPFWNFGDGRHGTLVVTTSTTVEQLYQSVRLPSDPPQFNPLDPRAVPDFRNLTITSNAVLSTAAWNGSTGGWIVLNVQGALVVDAGSAISATALGYGGGAAYASGNGPGGGGGGYYEHPRPGSTFYRSGGGGGYGTNGGGGSGNSNPSAGAGGGTYGEPTLGTLFMGSGGGGGETAGGNGGGVVAIAAGRLRADGQIDANGGGGGGSGLGVGGGGGSGGSILLRVVSATFGSVSATAGAGQSGAGAGGDGRIRIESSTMVTGTTAPAASILDNSASDVDGDGIPDNVEWGADPNVARDSDADGMFDYLDTDSDNDGIPDAVERGPDGLHPRDNDGDGLEDYRDSDSDNDGIPDSVERGSVGNQPLDSDGDGISDYRDADSDNDGIVDSIERGADGQHPRDTEGDGLPDYRDSDSNNNGIPDSVELKPDGSARLEDSDGDGLPDYWELFAGLDPNNPADAYNKPAGQPFTYLQKFYSGLNPLSTDTDGDGLSDDAELSVYGTNPLLTDSDGDGMPDKWEVDNGLDPRRNDADDDHDFDSVSNRDEYNGGVNSTKANSGDSDNNGVSDYVQGHSGQSIWQALYDRNDRLLGVRDARGSSFAYRYDGNGNITRQIKLGFDSDGDGLSDLWEFANGLDPNSPNGANGSTGDADGDGWTNLQEQLAGSDPNDASSKPGANGSVIGSLTAPFTPTNFVAAAGQLDNAGSEEIVVGADGAPAAIVNAIRIYTEMGRGWKAESVDVGSYGVTSIAVGQIGLRFPAIYLGLRKPGGNGRIVELQKNGATWQTTVIVDSVSDAAFVTGIRSTPAGNDLMLTLAPRFGPDGALYRAAYESGTWKISLLNRDTSHPASSNPLISPSRSTGVIVQKTAASATDRVVRLLDTGGIQIADPKVYPSVDEFGGVAIAPIWTVGSSKDGNGFSTVTVVSAGESGGRANLRVNLSYYSGSFGSIWMETNLQWPGPSAGMLISIPSIGHDGQNGMGGGSSVRFGGSTVYSTGVGQNVSNVLLHLLRVGTFVYSRSKVDTAPWSDWNSCPDANTLRFQCDISRPGSGNVGIASLDIDYVRYLSSGALVSAASSSSDFSNAEAAFNGTTNTWYAKTPSTQSWLNAQLYAWDRGGNLVTADGVPFNTWLQSKFPGEFWIGYHRVSLTSPWRWSNGSVSAFAAWGSGQPGAAIDQFYASANNGTWSSATGTELKPSVFEIKSPLAEVSTVIEQEPAATRRLQWSGQTMATGHFNSSVVTQSSIVEAFVDDKDASGTVTDGDEFAIAELVADGSPSSTRTLSRRTFASSSLATGYGLAAVRSRNGTSDFLVTAENDGQVFAWLPPTPGSALQRRTLSVAHTGKAWHSLERVQMTGGADGLAGLRVTPGSPQTADVVFWSPYELGFTRPPIIQQSLPSARIAATPASGTSHARVDVRLWDSEGNPSQVSLQYQNPPGTGLWTDATLLTIAGQPAAANPSLAAPPSGATHQLLWNAVQNLGMSFNGGVLLRARATDGSGAGDWSEPMFYTVNVTGDFDQDGMTDGWEIANNLDPNDASDATADPDGDGSANRMEFFAGTNPHNPASVFRVTNIARAGTSVTLTWSSVVGKTYVVQNAAVLGGTWSDVSGASVTAISASTNSTLTGISANAAYFRVRTGP